MQRWVNTLKIGTRKLSAVVHRGSFTIALSACLLMIGGAAFFARTAGRIPTPASPSATVSPVVMTPGSVETLEDAQDRLAQAELMWPVSGREILTAHSETEPQYNETLELWAIHKGVDIASTPGEAVLAARAGTVSASFKDPLLGYTIVLNHEDNLTTRYSNLATLQAVSPGDHVEAGQVIGSVGDSADSESKIPPHLHYEAYKAGAWALNEGMLEPHAPDSEEYTEQPE